MSYLCEKCGVDLKEVGVYTNKPTTFVYDNESELFEPFVESDDFAVNCCNCNSRINDTKLNMNFKF